LSKLGEGTFGKVVECWDRIRKEYCAVKIIRNVPKYRRAAFLELSVLNTLRKNDPGRTKHCVHLKEWFDYRGHICMVFMKLGMSLFDLLRKNGYRSFDLFHVQAFARQLMEAVAFSHSLKLIHTDLKPENILLSSHKYHKPEPKTGSTCGKRVPEKSDIFLIDFGSATFQDQHHSEIVSTRHYRAPEVIMGLGWTYPCDMWSVGCILAELVTGEALFKTHDDLEHLAMIQQVVGHVPAKMAKRASSRSAPYFDKSGKLLWPSELTLPGGIEAVEKLKALNTIISERCDNSTLPALDLFLDLMKGMLQVDPSRRISAASALSHRFFAHRCG